MTLIKSLQEVSPFQSSDQGQCLGHRHHLTKGECGFGLEKFLSSKAEIKVALVRVKRRREFPGLSSANYTLGEPFLEAAGVCVPECFSRGDAYLGTNGMPQKHHPSPTGK